MRVWEGAKIRRLHEVVSDKKRYLRLFETACKLRLDAFLTMQSGALVQQLMAGCHIAAVRERKYPLQA